MSTSIEESRASVADAFATLLQKNRSAEVAEFSERRHKGQFSNNLDADSSALYELVAPHVDSFNWIFDKNGGLDLAVNNLPTLTIPSKDNNPEVVFRISNVSIGTPTGSGSEDNKLLPHEARQLGLSYDAPMNVTIERRVGEGAVETMTRSLGRVPIMVRSSRCHLHYCNRRDMVAHKEEAGEWGGYFILNGNERLVRLLIMPRRNHIFGMIRSSFLNRGPEYTKYATSLRSVRKDQSAVTINVHYLETGSVNVRFVVRKQEFFIPAILVLKCLTGASDREIYEKITLNDSENAFESERVELMIRETKQLQLASRNDCLAYIGRHFRGLIRGDINESDAELGVRLFKEYLFIHVQDFDDLTNPPSDEAQNRAKFDILIFMIQKLFKLVQEKIKPDNIDSLACHEALLPGHLYLLILKEQLYDALYLMKSLITKDMNHGKARVMDANYWKKMFEMCPDVGRKLQYFLVTGNLVSRSGLDLMQVSGYTVVAEKLNYYRYLSHFRSVHRGQFFTTMKTTQPRKLLPESWGFVCPIHTPDGSPCGLLNHLSASCKVLTHSCSLPQSELLKVLYTLGMMEPTLMNNKNDLPVFLDGVFIGSVAQPEALAFSSRLRYLKVMKHPALYQYLEIFTVIDNSDGMWPSISLCTTSSRFIRPVYYLPTVAVTKPLVEFIGALEQLTMEISCLPQDFQPGFTTHQEISPMNILSVIASLTPFSDHNQSPRNMYQCQMGKQTMGTPYHSHPFRVDNKVYRIQNVQAPIVRNEGPYQKFLFDEYPMGFNAVVAVISYTGYDMEDAMIINKSAYERGFGHGSVYKYKVVDLNDSRIKGEGIHHHFSNVNTNTGAPGATVEAENRQASKNLDLDGLPSVGQHVQPDEPLYSVLNDISNTLKFEKYKDTEPAYIEEIRSLGTENGSEMQKVAFKLRMNRNPVFGDKFSSRHGQKGVLSCLLPTIDMPWTESGMTPDVIINPHAFPSRMTIGMLIESLAGKAGALHGKFQDGTPFQFDENNRAVDYFGQQLRAAGYNYLGSEPLYSGISGEPLMADIFVGCVFYQRLRHMVKDKFQARSTGPIDNVTHQPIKGRKVHGGIRFGEMERDSLLAHGVSFLLHDRLMNSSDYHTTYCCSDCGSILAAHSVQLQKSSASTSEHVTCRICNRADGVNIVAVPFVFLYLVNELAAMNIRITLDVK